MLEYNTSGLLYWLADIVGLKFSSFFYNFCIKYMKIRARNFDFILQLKTNFNLHCKTEKHSCKLNLISHVREGGAATAWMIPHIINGNLAQVRKKV